MAGITILSWFEENDPDCGIVQEVVVKLHDGTIVQMSEECGSYDLMVTASKPTVPKDVLAVIWEFVHMNSSDFDDKPAELRRPSVLTLNELGIAEHTVFSGSSEALFD